MQRLVQILEGGIEDGIWPTNELQISRTSSSTKDIDRPDTIEDLPSSPDRIRLTLEDRIANLWTLKKDCPASKEMHINSIVESEESQNL